MATGRVQLHARRRSRGASTWPRPGRGASWSSSPPAAVVFLARSASCRSSSSRSSIALLIAALVIPLVTLPGPDRAAARARRAAHRRHRRHRAVVGLLLTLAGQQIANGATDLADQTVAGPRRDQGLAARTARCTPATRRSTTTSTRPRTRSPRPVQGRRRSSAGSPRSAPPSATSSPASSSCCSRRTSSSPTATGSGPGWCGCRPAPPARHVDSSGRVAWISLTQFVRATVIVALVDAIGIAIGAAVLGVPFVLAIGVLVFLGAFVPLVGATVAGTVAVLVALVARSDHRAAHARRRHRRPADRGARAAAVPDGPLGVGAPARR